MLIKWTISVIYASKFVMIIREDSSMQSSMYSSYKDPTLFNLEIAKNCEEKFTNDDVLLIS